MAERLKDLEDRKLEALFRSESVPDDGFSARVVSRLKRRIWVRRFALPVGFVIGALIAAKPVLQLASFLPRIVTVLPSNVTNVVVSPFEGMFHGTTIILGMMLLGAALMIGHLLEH